MQPLAHIGVDLAQHARARIVADALHGRLGGEAGGEGLIETPPPAAILREHAEGFEHVAMLAGARHVAAIEHAVDHAGELVDRLTETPPLELHIFGNQPRHDDARLVQHQMTERHALGDGDTTEAGGLIAARIAHRLFGDETARGDHLGDHHGGGLKGLDLFVTVMTLSAVLHRQHAHGVAAAQDRDA